MARKSIRPLAQFGTKALEITKPVYRSAMGGMVGMAPFALSAETPEEFGAILGTGAGVSRALSRPDEAARLDDEPAATQFFGGVVLKYKF